MGSTRALAVSCAAVLSLVGISGCSAEAPGQSRDSPPAETIVEGLDTPWALAQLPDGSLLITERDSAQIKRVVDGVATVIGDLGSSVVPDGEGGLLGLAIGPDFAADPHIFIYYTGPDDNRVSRLEYNDTALGDPQPILTGLPKSGIHNGGRIKFGPDGFLYVGTGDAAQPALAQDPTSLAGKILRITPTGDPAPGNPFDNSPVYSLGHRNVQGLGWDSENRMWASEFGPEVDDELNAIVPGGNYGWPSETGAPGVEGFIDAQVVWPSTADSSPSGMAVIDDVAYIGGLRGERLWEVQLSNGSAQEPVSRYDGDHGRLRDVLESSTGGLLIATNEGNESRVLEAPTD